MKMNNEKKIGIILAALFFMIGIAGTASCQPNIQSATREVNRAGSDEMRNKMKKPPQASPKIKVEEGKVSEEGEKFFVKKITLVGTESFPAETFKDLIQKYENKEDSLGDLDNLSKSVQQEYLNRGIISTCFVPPQDMKNQEITMQVVEAKVGKIEVERKRTWYFNREMIAFYWRMKPGEVLSYDKLSRSLYLMNKNPDRQVKATIHAGDTPGTTDTILNVDERFPVHLTGSIDREGAFTTGRERYGFGAKDTNMLLVDDTFISGYSFGEHFKGSYIFYNVPITNFGTSFTAGYSNSQSHPVGDVESFGINATSDDLSFYVYQDLFEKAEYFGDVYGGIDFKEKAIDLDTSGTLNHDKTRVLKTGSSFMFKNSISVTTIGADLSQGIDALGARKQNQYSSRSASSTFTKLNLQARQTMVWPLDLQTNAIFKCQLASERLTPTEEFSIGGIDSVRGYSWGDYQADNAFNANFELLFPAFMIPKEIMIPYLCDRPLKDYITGVTFIDYGYGEKRNLLPGEKDNATEVGVGAGFRVRLFNQGTLRMEWGFPIGNKPLAEGGGSVGRFHFSFDMEDHFPDEMARIAKTIRENNIQVLAWQLLNNEINRPESLLRARLDEYKQTADSAYASGDYARAKEYYSKIYDLGISLHDKVGSYIKKLMDHRDNLNSDNKMARKFYNNGDYARAKDIWLKVIDEAQIQPLTLEY